MFSTEKLAFFSLKALPSMFLAKAVQWINAFISSIKVKSYLGHLFIWYCVPCPSEQTIGFSVSYHSTYSMDQNTFICLEKTLLLPNITILLPSYMYTVHCRSGPITYNGRLFSYLVLYNSIYMFCY